MAVRPSATADRTLPLQRSTTSVGSEPLCDPAHAARHRPRRAEPERESDNEPEQTLEHSGRLRLPGGPAPAATTGRWNRRLALPQLLGGARHARAERHCLHHGTLQRSRREAGRAVDRAADPFGRRDESLDAVDLDRGVDDRVARRFEQRDRLVVQRIAGVAQITQRARRVRRASPRAPRSAS